MDSISSDIGSIISMPIYVEQFNDIISFQGTIEFDPTILSFNSYQNNDLDVFYGQSQIEQGILTYSWYDESLQGQALEDGANVFNLEFNVIGGDDSVSQLCFIGNPTVLEVVDNNFNTLEQIYNCGDVYTAENQIDDSSNV